ncbi:hypothetical protein [Pontibacter sp. G13]|uniref:hypothetical protein n=1 Tax=Pontibacter sp. G13 TaxID=3074898 RepID=UPI00288A13E8|nr:hypothetical protein [Pontibacter sp. G13]WNJ21581.1 hypothetical protein RJD25_29015 [Pontibacter sp. G13]
MKNQSSARERLIVRLSVSVLVLCILAGGLAGGILWMIVDPVETPIATPAPPIVNGLDVESGLIAEGDYQLVKAQCTGCHSGKLIAQNRATRAGWLEMIRWMQETQNLWDLGAAESPILDYLSTHYAPGRTSRRAPLEDAGWYDLER